MSKRTFDHLYAEICVAAGRRVSRYALWLLVWESGGDPDELSRDRLRVLLDGPLDALLREEGLALPPRVRRRLARRVLAFDPHHPTPEEWMLRSMAVGTR